MAQRSGVNGLANAQKQMRRLSPEAVKRIDGALDAGAEEILMRAKMIAPKQSGELREALEVRKGLDGLSARASSFATRLAGKTGGALTRSIGVFPESRNDKGWYAVFVEMGTERTDAKPFLRPSFITLRRRVQGRISRAVNKGLKEVARKGVGNG